MTPKEKLGLSLQRKPFKGRVPHFELDFFLTMEAFGEVHPRHRSFSQWNQMKPNERELHRINIAELVIKVAEKYGHSAIRVPVITSMWDVEENVRMIDLVRKLSNDKYALFCAQYDGTFAIPDGNSMMEVSMKLADAPEEIKEHHQKVIDRCIDTVAKITKQAKIDVLFLTCDYCFNNGPFLSPDQFAEFVFPQLKYELDAFRSLGCFTIKHTDGNIMPIVDQLVNAGPDALHSLDPQGGVDIAVIKQKYGDRVALMGNVNCGYMDTGTDEQVIESARYALKNGMGKSGYIFSTSNCVYTGMELRKYELILDVWEKEGNY